MGTMIGELICFQCGLKVSLSHEGAAACPSCGAALPGPETIAADTPTTPWLGASDQRSAITFRLPGFEVGSQLGRGGMGIVYRARQLNLNREVAIKVLPPAFAGDARRLSQFRHEATVAAGLTDSHILPVFDIPEVDGVPVLVMPYIDGSDLGRVIIDRRLLREGQPPARLHAWATLPDREYLARILPLLDQLVDAVTVIHEAKVLHRDIKPSNVMVDQRGNLWLTDFGLARLADERSGTEPGTVMGTRGYMSPEQSRGEAGSDARSDVFSMGVTLYETLTLRLPYGKNGATDRQPPPTPPSRLQPLLPRDFDAVILKALEPNGADRYGSAGELREDWGRVRQGLPPRARPFGPSKRLAHFARRHFWALAAAVLFLLLMGAMAAWALITPPAPGPEVLTFRKLRVVTRPPGARIVLVPLDQKGELHADKALRAPPSERTPVTLESVPVGTYLVVADLPGYGFHEVFRTVPQHNEPTGAYAHTAWNELGDGTVVWRPIPIPPPFQLHWMPTWTGRGLVPLLRRLTDGMTRFDGGEFIMGDAALSFAGPPHPRKVAAFDLDQTEVTILAYRQASNAPADDRAVDSPNLLHAATFVSYDEALSYAERVGKRLPDEAEYEFAATAGKIRRFPWGNDPRPAPGWPLGRVREPAFDRTDTNPPVYGLYSNAGEWTTSWHNPYPGSPLAGFEYPPALAAIYPFARVVRGAPYDAREQGVHLGRWAEGPCQRQSITREQLHAWLGFRCARSVKPRFLD